MVRKKYVRHSNSQKNISFNQLKWFWLVETTAIALKGLKVETLSCNRDQYNPALKLKVPPCGVQLAQEFLTKAIYKIHLKMWKIQIPGPTPRDSHLISLNRVLEFTLLISNLGDSNLPGIRINWSADLNAHFMRSTVVDTVGYYILWSL